MNKRTSREERLEQLRRSIAGGDFAAAEKLLHAAGKRPPGVERGGLPFGAVTPNDQQPPRTDRPPSKTRGEICAAAWPIALENACPGREVKIDTGKEEGTFWLVRRTLAQVSPDQIGVASQYQAVLRGARQQFDELEASAELCHAANARPEDLLFMDVETCGTSETAIFLVGLMSFADGQLVFEQNFARNYGEEPGILRAFGRRQEEAGVLVTFNGRAFDVPLIRERSIAHGLDEPWSSPPHLDLLPEVRKRWRGRLRSFRLQALERRFFNRRRTGDIPSDQIPDAYREYVRTGDARKIGAVLRHNLEDLLTMARIVCVLLTGCDPIAG